MEGIGERALGRAASVHDPFAVGVEEPTAAQGGSFGKVVACFCIITNKGDYYGKHICMAS